MNENSQNFEKLSFAGKEFKSIGVSLAISLLNSILLVIFVFILDAGSIKIISIFLGMINLVLFLKIISSFIEAGNLLEMMLIKTPSDVKIISPKETKNLDHKSNLVKYKTDKGVLEIPPAIKLTGQPAFMNGEPAEDGKYKYGLFNTIEIKEGKVING